MARVRVRAKMSAVVGVRVRAGVRVRVSARLGERCGVEHLQRMEEAEQHAFGQG